MEPWFAEHELLIRMMVGLTALTLGSYGFTWVCYLLVGKRISSLRSNDLRHIDKRLDRIEEILDLPEDKG